MAATGLGFFAVTAFVPLLAIAVVGTLNPSSGDVSVFLPTEQAFLAEHATGTARTRLYAFHNVGGNLAGALGALVPGAVTGRIGFLLYVAVAAIAALVYRGLPGDEPRSPKLARPLERSRSVVLQLAALFSLDAAGGGLVVQSLLVVWLHLRFDLSPASTATVFFCAGTLAAFSQFLAPRLARRIGLVRTMVFTHLPANGFLVPAAWRRPRRRPSPAGCSPPATPPRHSCSPDRPRRRTTCSFSGASGRPSSIRPDTRRARRVYRRACREVWARRPGEARRVGTVPPGWLTAVTRPRSVTSEGEEARVESRSDPVRLARHEVTTERQVTAERRVLARRQVLARLAAVGATLGVSPALLRAAPAGAGPTVAATGAGRAQAVLPPDPLTLDTLSAVVAFAVPGDDEHSRHQGVTLAEPGGIAAEAPQLLGETLNSYLAVPEVAAFLVEALQTELAAVRLPDGETAATWLEGLLETDGTLPLAPLMAALLGLLAVQVDPASVAGPFLTPFSRLSWDDKAEVWRRFEGELPDLFTIGAPGSRLPVVSDILDLLSTLGGLLRFAAGAVLEIAVFASYTEYAVFDPATRTLTGRPVGWDLTEYPPDEPVAGWDELIGYYQGRTTADA